MFKYLLILLILGYVFRRILFTPLNQGNQEPSGAEKNKKETGYSDKAGEYTDYEEIK
jgi:hypothetical protein